MIKWILKFFIKTPYTCCMEFNCRFGCYLSLQIPSVGHEEGIRDFFAENHFLIAHRMFDPEWENKIQLEEIYKKLLFLYNFHPKDKNIIIIMGEKKVYIPERKIYIPLPPGGVFVYDKSKLKVIG